jgi:DNA (cytosine-5)-methyltransferase 1
VTLRLLDTFSGIGGFSYAAERLVGGYQTVAFVEREPFCQSILRKHWSDVPIYDDITTFNPELGSADVVCGGFPCQDISTAGKQAGIKEGTRSGLFYELMRVIRMVGPRYIVLENVAAITSNGLDTVLGALAEAGFDAEWACIPAADVGACHRRDRWWAVAYANQVRRNRDSHAWPDNRENGAAGSSRVIDALATEYCRADLAHPHHQRQQERQPATIAGGSGRTGWGDAPGRLNPDWRSYLSEPVLCRGDDGLSGRVDRLKALGNAVVPQVAAIPLARVLELERVRATDPAAHPPCP